jgi:hypothetical protein
MPVILEDNTFADLEEDALDATLSDPEINSEMQRFTEPLGDVGDLSYGGRAGEVNVHPNPSRENGKMVGYGRPTVRRAWTWDGTETVLTLGWNPEGTEHNSARPYLAKKHCHCCGYSGFRISRKVQGCPMCIKNSCPYCKGGADRSKVIACFYLNRNKVPYPRDTTGEVDCFLESCVRRGSQGFKTEADMRFHARTKHRMEYASFQESEAARKGDETDELRRRVDTLTAALLARPAESEATKKPPTEAQRQASQANIQKALAARKAKKDKVPG